MGTLYIVATPIGNLGDFSPRAVETLKKVDLILAEDTRQTIKLLNYFNIKKKMISYHKYNEAKTSDSLIENLKNEMNIALVSDAGTPCISDPGYILVKKAREAGIEVLGVPGCSAVIDALSVSGLDTSSFSFYGFVPTDNKDKKLLFEEIKYSKIKTKVLYESPKRILKLLNDIKSEIPGCVVCVCSELTKLHEKCYYGKIDEVYEKLSKDEGVNKGEYVILISNDPLSDYNDDICLEATLMNTICKRNCTLKEAIKIISTENNIKKNDLYEASLNLKKIIKNI